MKDTKTSLFNIYLAYPTCRKDNDNFYRLIKNYKKIGVELSAYLIDWEKMDGLPKTTLYVPAEHELFIQSAYLNKVLSEEQILVINCDIIAQCNLLVLFGGFKTMNGDVLKEVQYARSQGVAIYTMPDLSPHAIGALKLAIITINRAGG